MTTSTREPLVGLAERLRAKSERERAIANSSDRTFALLKPELDRFNAKEAPWDTYTVRLALDHRNSARKDHAFADDLAAAATALEEQSRRVEELTVALHDAINRPKGVVPASAERFYRAELGLSALPPSDTVEKGEGA